MEEEYKVKYQLLGSTDCAVTEWMVEPKARKAFDKLKNDSKCIWAELLYSPLEEESESFYGEQVVDQFTKKVVELLGMEMVMPLKGV